MLENLWSGAYDPKFGAIMGGLFFVTSLKKRKKGRIVGVTLNSIPDNIEGFYVQDNLTRRQAFELHKPLKF